MKKRKIVRSRDVIFHKNESVDDIKKYVNIIPKYHVDLSTNSILQNNITNEIVVHGEEDQQDEPTSLADSSLIRYRRY